MPLCLLCAFFIINVARQGQKFAFRDLNIEENALFLNKKGVCFTLKGHFVLRKKGHFSLRKKGTFRVLEFFYGGGGASVPSKFKVSMRGSISTKCDKIRKYDSKNMVQ